MVYGRKEERVIELKRLFNRHTLPPPPPPAQRRKSVIIPWHHLLLLLLSLKDLKINDNLPLFIKIQLRAYADIHQ